VSLDRVLAKLVGVGMILLGLCLLPFACKQPRTKSFLAQLPTGGIASVIAPALPYYLHYSDAFKDFLEQLPTGGRLGNCSCITLLPTSM